MQAVAVRMSAPPSPALEEGAPAPSPTTLHRRSNTSAVSSMSDLSEISSTTSTSDDGGQFDRSGKAGGSCAICGGGSAEIGHTSVVFLYPLYCCVRHNSIFVMIKSVVLSTPLYYYIRCIIVSVITIDIRVLLYPLIRCRCLIISDVAIY